MTRVLFSGMIFSFLVGCGVAVNYAPLNPAPHPLQARTPDKVEVLTIPPSQKYVEVGRITAHHDSFSNNDAMVAQMRQEAANRGCDALVITQEGRPENAQADADAACVVYSDK